MLTSVIIPAHNEQDYIRATLESYAKQSDGTFELIVVANGCNPTDDTAQIAEDLGARVFELEEGNVSKARNHGVSQSSGDLLVFNDADTLVATDYLAEIQRATTKGYDMGCALFKPENYHPVTIFYSIMTLGSGCILGDAGGNMFTRRDLFDKAGGFDLELKIGEDIDLSRRMKAAGGKYKFLHSTHIITSMRQFEENGYFNELFVNQLWPYLKGMFSNK